MALTNLLSSASTPVLLLTSAGLVLLFVAYTLLTGQVKVARNAPGIVKEDWPIVGAYRFFSQRNSFCKENSAASETGNFSFHVGNKSVAAISGHENRKLFLDYTQLDFAAGYVGLFQGGVDTPDDHEDPKLGGTWIKFFSRTLVNVTRRERLIKALPAMTSDALRLMDDFGNSGVTDPFDSIYTLVYQMSMRIIGPNEISNDPKLLKHTLNLLDELQENSSAFGIIMPRLPTPANIRRNLGGMKLFRIYQNIVNTRAKNNIREEDTMQELIDSGISTLNILKFVLGALFAAQVNTSINCAYVLCYLACNSEWRKRCYDELVKTCAAYTPEEHKGKPLAEQLAFLTPDVWETGLPDLYLCLKESIRMNMVGTAFRRNTSGRDIPLAQTGPNGQKEVVHPGQYAIYNVIDSHYNPDIFSNPFDFDPSRFERKEDAKAPYAWIGWGAGRHPCLGMKTARYEYSVIAAHFLAMYDFDGGLEDVKGNKLSRVPDADIEGWGAAKPMQPLRLRYRRKEKA